MFCFFIYYHFQVSLKSGEVGLLTFRLLFFCKLGLNANVIVEKIMHRKCFLTDVIRWDPFDFLGFSFNFHKALHTFNVDVVDRFDTVVV